MQIKIKYVLPIWWVNSFWFEDADIIDIIIPHIIKNQFYWLKDNHMT